MTPSENSLNAEPRGGSGEMFDRIAARYDLLNRLISLGIDQRWRRRTVHSLQLSPGARVLDLATGTADLALLIARMQPDARITGLDPSLRMLEIGRNKITQAALSDRIELCAGRAESLPYPDQSFEAVTIAFGIRNVPDRLAALREMARVLVPGGRVGILELSEPPKGPLGAMARLHVHHIVPWLGGVISGVREYRYLQQSIAAFPPAPQFCELMSQAGFQSVTATPQTFGVCHLYVGVRGS
jgi:demethylmenaquinone methyltransferase/2-methoxy-6-polyprenyl-1,4-benzoquinol methylase